MRPDTAAQGETALTKRIFITFCAAAACCVLLGACESGSLAAAAGKRTRPADLGELQFITPAEGDPIATLSTTLGDISFVLYPDIAPMAVENFVGLAQQGYYNGLSFHRVIEGFLVQTGDATGTGAGGSTIWNGNSYPNEISDRLHHYAGAVAMAHAPDGASGNAAVECGEDDRPLEDVIVNSVTIGTYSAAQSGSTPASGASGSDSAA